MPFTSVVFPAPRSPRSNTMAPGFRSDESCRPSSVVSSAEWVSNVFILSLQAGELAVGFFFADGESIAQTVDDVRGDHGILALQRSSNIAGEAMEIHGPSHVQR